VSRKRKEVDLEKNSNPEGAFSGFLRRVCPEGMFISAKGRTCHPIGKKNREKI
jgi:hypothetical protein